LARIKLAIVGVGNCASSLIQGLHFYREPRGEAAPDAGLGVEGVHDPRLLGAEDAREHEAGARVVERAHPRVLLRRVAAIAEARLRERGRRPRPDRHQLELAPQPFHQRQPRAHVDAAHDHHARERPAHARTSAARRRMQPNSASGVSSRSRTRSTGVESSRIASCC